MVQMMGFEPTTSGVNRCSTRLSYTRIPDHPRHPRYTGVQRAPAPGQHQNWTRLDEAGVNPGARAIRQNATACKSAANLLRQTEDGGLNLLGDGLEGGVEITR